MANNLLTPNKELLGADGRPLKPQAKNKQVDATREMERTIRIIEQALGKDLPTLCAVLADVHKQKWPMAIDDAVPTSKCVITLSSTLYRDLKNGLQIHNQQIIRLGSDYEPALKKLMASLPKNSPEGETPEENQPGKDSEDGKH